MAYRMGQNDDRRTRKAEAMNTILQLDTISKEVVNLPHSMQRGALVWHKRAEDWHVCIQGEEDYWACGKTPNEAIGDLIRSHPERFAILPLE